MELDTFVPNPMRAGPQVDVNGVMSTTYQDAILPDLIPLKNILPNDPVFVAFSKVEEMKKFIVDHPNL